MSANSSSADTVLCVDFVTANTRALLFDVVEAGYRFVGYGEAPSTINAPYRDASEGLHHALETLQRITGRQVLDDHAHLIMPATTDGRGVDGFVATSSAGPAVRAVLVGLLPDVSLASARRIAASSYINVLDTFSLGDVRGEDEQIDAVIAARPELLIIAGGSDGGATRALLKLVETVSLACHLLPPGIHPRALFVGNTDLQTRMNELWAACRRCTWRRTCSRPWAASSLARPAPSWGAPLKRSGWSRWAASPPCHSGRAGTSFPPRRPRAPMPASSAACRPGRAGCSAWTPARPPPASPPPGTATCA